MCVCVCVCVCVCQSSFICIKKQLNGFKYCYRTRTILFNITHLLAHS